MTCEEFLPREEPGRPLLHVPPGSIDILMGRIADYRRQQRRRRRAAAVVAIAGIVTAVWMIAPRRADDIARNDVAGRHTSPVTPSVKTPPPFPQNAVKQDTPAPHTPPPTDTAVADIRPGGVKITLDGKEITDPAQLKAILKSMDDCNARRVNLVRDGRPVNYTVPAGNSGSSRCGAAPSPRQ